MRFQGVIFDWRGTLFHDISNEDWIRSSAESISRTLSDSEIGQISLAIDRAGKEPDVSEANRRADASPAAHVAAAMMQFKRAGLDDDLANAIYQRDGMFDATFPYPDTPDVLRRLKENGCRIAICSDINYDLRPIFNHYGLVSYIDSWALSFEHGWVKPEPDAFLTALALLELPPSSVLMVGDRHERDGGAALVGITTLILPPVPNFSIRGLDIVLSLVGEPSAEAS